MAINDVPPPKVKKGLVDAPKAKKNIKTKAQRIKERATRAKQSLRAAERELKKLESNKNVVAGAGIVDSGALTPTIQQYMEQQEVIFKPNDGPQTAFLAASEREVFYGGARGGGKSFALLMDPLRFCGNKNHRALIIRRTMPELRDLIFKSQQLYPKAFPNAKWREQEKEWRFPSGARIEFGFCESRQDALRYQGQQYTWIGVDELPQFPTADIWNDLRGSLRSVDSDLQAYMRATGNPGNIGSSWVKEMFIDPATPGERFTVSVDLPDGRKSGITRRFIPSTVYDNPHLTYDDSYITMLASLPEVQRKQWLEGNWDVFDGAAFSEFDKAIHVVEPFDLPSNWLRFRAADWGFTSPACCLWFAVDYDNNIWVYRELYTTKKNAEEFGNLVLDAEWGEPIRYGVLDSSAWAQRGDTGPSIAETMIKIGCRWRPSDRSPNSRRNGKLEVHRRLAVDPDTNEPRLRIFSNCKNLIRTLPTLPLDANNSEDIDTDAEDHAYDALRYGLMSRPINPSLLMAYDKHNITKPARYSPADKIFGY